jgi:carbonic anhydrase
MWSHIVFAAALVSIAESSCLHATSFLQRRKSENNTVEVAKFGYTDPIGPLLWKTLAAENVLCEEGENQSPINIGKYHSITYDMDEGFSKVYHGYFQLGNTPS